MHALIVIPTFNERYNILKVLNAIVRERSLLYDDKISVLVADDFSPDGTADIVHNFSKNNEGIYLISGRKQGLGIAYRRAFKCLVDGYLRTPDSPEEFRLPFSLNEVDVVFEMDADLSHNPADIPRFLAKIRSGYDFVIGSRYVEGGAVTGGWPFSRRFISKFGNIFARYFARLHGVHDCTSGFRAIRSSLLAGMNFNALGMNGYAFQISFLYQAIRRGAQVSEIPIIFADRTEGKSKMRFKDIMEFGFTCLFIRVREVFSWLISNIYPVFIVSSALFLSGILYGLITLESIIVTTVVVISAILISQGIFSLYWMLFAWENPVRLFSEKIPKKFLESRYSFTALVPARHETHVIADTIRAVHRIDYPAELKETLILCRSDDVETISAAEKAIREIASGNIRLVIFDDLPITKAHSLNVGLKEAKNDIVTIFDAEDEPHPEMYKAINTVFLSNNVDVVQSGVQLMNHDSHWFSGLNVLEYFFWFKSGLHFFSLVGSMVPLAGNTVFFRRAWLTRVNGWDEKCLTEDADIGIRLSNAGANIKVVYSEEHVTKEETPANIKEFIRQRTRWNHGFLQIFTKGEWKELPTLRQKIFAIYILLSPIVQASFLLYIPFSIVISLTQELPLGIALFSYTPLYIFLFQLLTFMIGMYEFTRAYKLKFSWLVPFKILVTFYPYQALLLISSMRALYRMSAQINIWEKTLHQNAHREIIHIPAVIPETEI